MFKKLKSLFVVDEGGSDQKPADQLAEDVQPDTSAPASETPASSGQVPNSGPVSAEPGKVNAKFTDVLLGAMDKANLDGFDYLEYKQSMMELDKMNSMDEPTRYKSAFAMAKTMGATPQKLVETASHYLRVLKQEDSKFQQALSNQRTRQIGDKEQQLKNLVQLIKDKEAQIEKMQAEIVEHNKQMEQIKQEVSGASIKVETTKNNFVASYQHITRQIERDVENMKKYLK